MHAEHLGPLLQQFKCEAVPGARHGCPRRKWHSQPVAMSWQASPGNPTKTVYAAQPDSRWGLKVYFPTSTQRRSTLGIVHWPFQSFCRQWSCPLSVHCSAWAEIAHIAIHIPGPSARRRPPPCNPSAGLFWKSSTVSIDVVDVHAHTSLLPAPFLLLGQCLAAGTCGSF